jgi:hypothetical protein
VVGEQQRVDLLGAEDLLARIQIGCGVRGAREHHVEIACIGGAGVEDVLPLVAGGRQGHPRRPALVDRERPVIAREHVRDLALAAHDGVRGKVQPARGVRHGLAAQVIVHCGHVGATGDVGEDRIGIARFCSAAQVQHRVERREHAQDEQRRLCEPAPAPLAPEAGQRRG